jgi:hypothetical protein
MKTCDLCTEKAAWRWDPGVVAPFYLCDDHAATKDLADLIDLTGAGEL